MITALAGLVLLSGCATDVGTADEFAEAEAVESANTLVAELTEGNATLRFEQDSEGGIYVIQSFDIGTAPFQNLSQFDGDLVAAYEVLAPNTPVPDALRAVSDAHVDGVQADETADHVEEVAGYDPLETKRYNINEEWFKDRYCGATGVNYSWCELAVGGERSKSYKSHQSGGVVCADAMQGRLRVYRSGKLKYDIDVDEGRCRWVQYHHGHTFGGHNKRTMEYVGSTTFLAQFAGFGDLNHSNNLPAGW
jgi:hypothetical protein